MSAKASTLKRQEAKDAAQTNFYRAFERCLVKSPPKDVFIATAGCTCVISSNEAHIGTETCSEEWWQTGEGFRSGSAHGCTVSSKQVRSGRKHQVSTMTDQNTMAHQRPNFPQRPSMPAPAFSPPYSHASPPNHMNFPSPAQQSPSMQYSQPPANKRPRLSPGAQSPYDSPSFSVGSIRGGAGSPVDGMSFNDNMPAPPPPGSMGPPLRPVEKATDIHSLEDNLAGTGVNLDEEERQLTATSFPSFGHPTPGSSFLSQNTSFGTTSTNGSFERPGSAGRQDAGYNYNVQSNGEQLTPEEVERRKENQANWQAARHSQHALWKMFLAGDPLERKLNERTYEQGIRSPKDGLYYATKAAAPQRTRVNGLDGASQIIDQGETILSTTGGGEVLGDIMKLISLSAKERVTGLLDQSARLAQERKDHSKGRVPTEWKAVAVVLATSTAGEEDAVGPAAAPSLKRTFSQLVI